MEAVNNLVSAASKAIWGEKNKDNVTRESKEEPISGVQGDTSKGEPYDAGNMDTTEAAEKKSDPSNEDPGVANASSNMPGNSTKAQVDTRGPSEAHASPESAAKKTNIDNDAEPLDPKDLDGPGPRPIEQVAREHGGDAGHLGKDEPSAPAITKSDSGVDLPEAASKPKGAATDDAALKNSDGEGTGEKYTRSSGLQEDGGDFDAAKAGAGREADRLLEEKGIHQPKPSATKSESPVMKDACSGKSSSPERKGMKGLGQKIKAKLHPKSNS